LLVQSAAWPLLELLTQQLKLLLVLLSYHLLRN